MCNFANVLSNNHSIKFIIEKDSIILSSQNTIYINSINFKLVL